MLEHHPPGPDFTWFGLPLLRQMKRDYLGFVQRLHAQYGDISYMRLGFEHAYDVFAPELIREVLVDNARSFVRWERATEVFAQAAPAKKLSAAFPLSCLTSWKLTKATIFI